jgi:hypothetical protein
MDKSHRASGALEPKASYNLEAAKLKDEGFSTPVRI